MTERKVGVTDVASGAGVADIRTRERSATGCEQYLIPEIDRVVPFRGMVASFRMPGVATVNRPLMSIFNKTGSGVLLAVATLVGIFEMTTNSSSTRTLGVSRIGTAPTDGTLNTPVEFDTAQTHNANVEVRSAASADGTTTTLTATPGTSGYRTYVQKSLSPIGQLVSPEYPWRATSASWVKGRACSSWR